jgi:hypothetical protein
MRDRAGRAGVSFPLILVVQLLAPVARGDSARACAVGDFAAGLRASSLTPA